MTGEEARLIICKKCGIKPIKFDPNQRSKRGILIPLDPETNEPHYCDIISPFVCMVLWCNNLS